jgi:tetratricopeptide (TPR) repeat protein
MRKYFLLAVLIVSTQIFLMGQGSPEGMRRDSLQIDSMQKLIPLTKDTARINFLNKFCRKIIYSAYPMKRKIEWAMPYVQMTYQEAKQSGYKVGVAKALMWFCQLHIYSSIENTRNKKENSSNLIKYGQTVSELIEISKEIKDPIILGGAYDYQADYFGKIKKPDEVLVALIKALDWYKTAGAESEECETNLNISYILLDKGEFEKALEYCTRSLELAKKLTAKSGPDDINEVWLQLGYINISDLYKAAGDFETALNLLLESRQFHYSRKSSSTWDMEGELGELFLESGQYDSALHYLKPGIKNRKFSYGWTQVAKAYLESNNMDSASKYYNLSIDSLEKRGKMPAVIDGLRKSYYGKARILFQQKKYNDALKFARKSLVMEQQRTNKMELVRTYELMSQLFYKSGKIDSAYLYLVKHNELKNSLLTRQFLFRLSNYKKEVESARKEATIGFLNRDNKIIEQKLKQEAQLKYFLLAGIAGLLITSFLFFRYHSQKRRNEKLKLENELKVHQLESDKKQAELHQRAIELEMQALRAQMNPHFIFNCLNSINRFIYKNETKEASDYLTRFSRLIRMVLLHSQKKLVPLEDELEMLKLYLDMERLRFKNAFDYHITTTNAIENSSVFIPPLLLQPFCENAIWHGLMHKDGPGHLNIELNEDNGVLNCIITDDGVGREKAEEYKSKSAEKEKSMGLKITTERLSLLNQGTTGGTFYKIEDVRNEQGEIAGTRVKLQIKYKENVEEIV